VKTLCIYNPKAGRCTRRGLEEAFRGRAHWGSVEFRSLHDCTPDGWDDLLRGFAKVAVLGGDGSLHCVIQHIVHKDIELCALPAGTANDLCHALGLPTTLSKALDALEGGRTVAYDTIAANGRHVVTGGGFGLGFQAADSANKLRSGPLRIFFRRGLRAKIYILTLAWHGLFAPPSRTGYRSSVGGRERKGSTQSILFCNQPFMGRRVLIAPGTSAQDGRFHLVEFMHADTRGILGSLARLKGKAPKPDALLERAETERADIEFDHAVPAYGDGEILPAAARWELVCHRGSVRMRVPAGFGSGGHG
jgi:diacylglycerol kinase family enzyme